MKNLIKMGMGIAMACSLLCGCTSLQNPSLEKGDRIVFLGDSITSAGAKPGGYVVLTAEEIAKAYPNAGIEIIGAGISGNRVPDCQKRLDSDVLQKTPSIVVIYIGINDVWHWNYDRGTTKADFESGLLNMIAKIKATGARVILCTPTVIGEKSDGTNELDSMLDEYSDISRKVAVETDSQLIDLRKAFIAYLKEINPDQLHEGVLTSDSVHLNAQGNAFLAGLMIKGLNVDVE